MLSVKSALRAQRDEGSALVTVLIVMLVLTIGGLALSAIVVNTAGMVASSKGTAQSRAAADAGLAHTLGLAVREKDICGAPVDDDLGDGSSFVVTRDCASVPGFVVFSSVGTAPGEAKTTTEATYIYTPAPVIKKEPALITRAPLNLSALKIRAIDPANPATVWVIPDAGVSGDFSCNSGGAIAGSVYLPAGTVFGDGGCEVTGDVYAEKDITIKSGTKIHGDLVSLTGKITLSGGITVDGGVYASGDVILSGGPIVHGDVVSSAGSVRLTGGMPIGGNIHAKLDVVGSGLSARFVQNIYAGRNLNLAGGPPSARDRIMFGGAFTFATGVQSAWAVTSVTRELVQPQAVVPTLPNAPEWQGITQSDLDALVTNATFDKVMWTGSCAYSWWPEHEMITKIKNLTKPTIIDARACAVLNLHEFSGITQLKTDIVFLAPSFNIQDQKFQSADGAKHRLWFISPESPGRNCAAVPAISIRGTTMLPSAGTSPISAMIFTQCTVDFPNGGEGWQGSIQAGVMAGKPNFWYESVGFPGSTHPGEETPGGPVSPILGELVSRHDVANQ